MTTNFNLTELSLQLFIRLANDAGNWSGTPLLDVSKEQRGNLTQLKKAGLVETFRSDNCDWVSFTQAGYRYACEVSQGYRDCFGDWPEGAAVSRGLNEEMFTAYDETVLPKPADRNLEAEWRKANQKANDEQRAAQDDAELLNSAGAELDGLDDAEMAKLMDTETPRALTA